jgi:hypothetical protein
VLVCSLFLKLTLSPHMKHMCAGKAENNSQKHPSSALQLFTPTYEVYFALAKSIVNMAHVLLTVMLV